MKLKQSSDPVWSCPNCGALSPSMVSIYNERLRFQSFTLCPILPTCSSCGAELSYVIDHQQNDSISVIVLTGTCASGKSAIAEVLASKYGFSCIDGDCVMQMVKHKRGIAKVAFNGSEMFEEMAHEIDILTSLKKDIVISHVIVPEDLPKYRAIFLERGLNYRIFLLQPDYATTVSRSKTRTYFHYVTDEYWIKHFYDQSRMLQQQNHPDVIVVDNSHYSAGESADRVIRLYEVAIDSAWVSGAPR